MVSAWDDQICGYRDDYGNLKFNAGTRTLTEEANGTYIAVDIDSNGRESNYKEFKSLKKGIDYIF